MLVKNNTPRLITLAGKVSLNPGVNDVDDAIWSDVSGTGDGSTSHLDVPAAAAMFVSQDGEKPWLELVTSDGSTSEGSTPVAAPKGPADMDAKHAQDLVAGTFDEKLLKKWKTTDTRATVQGAIDTQLERMKLTEDEKAGRTQKKS